MARPGRSAVLLLLPWLRAAVPPVGAVRPTAVDCEGVARAGAVALSRASRGCRRQGGDNCSESEAFEAAQHRKTWSDLSNGERAAFGSIGYTEEGWNDFESAAADALSWSELTEDQRQQLMGIGYTEHRWECDAQGGYPDDDGSAETWLVDQSLLPGGVNLVLASEAAEVVMAVGPKISSAVISSIMGRLLAGMYGLRVKFRRVQNAEEVYSLLENGEVDLVMDLSARPGELPEMANVSALGVLSEVGNVHHIYTTIPKQEDLQYFNDTHSLVPYWTSLRSPSFRRWLPTKPCTMGPWGGNASGYGVWCMEPLEAVPVIWSRGPRGPGEPPSELMAFLNAKGLALGLELLDPYELDRRVLLASRAGAPALFDLAELSQTASGLEGQILSIDLPSERLCGQLGSWESVGKWACAPERRWWYKLAGRTVRQSELLEAAVSMFALHDEQLAGLFRSYREHYRAHRDVRRAVASSAAEFISDHEATWRPWFRTPEPMSTSGRAAILALVCSGLLLVAGMELARLQEKPRPPPPDSVDRRRPPNYPLEALAGTNSSLSMLMDAVGIAGILLSSSRLTIYQDQVIKHVLVGQFACQCITCLFSKYETPVVTSSIEMLPFLAILVEDIEKRTEGRSGMCVLATLLVASSLICVVSGFIMYTVGQLKLGGLLRYLPYSVKVGIQAGMGIVLLAISLELCCDENFLELESFQDVSEFFAFDVSLLWLPAFLSAITIFSVNTFVCESPYTILGFIVVAIGGFHAIRACAGMNVQRAQQAGWLYGDVPPGQILSLWQSLGWDLICWEALTANFSTIMIACLVAPVLNNVSDLAVVKSVLPPRDMGDSDFNEELVVQGRSHILAALAVGFSSDYGNDDTIVHRMFGGKRRLSMYVHCGTLALCLVCPFITKLLAFVPKFANGGPIALAGLEFLYDSLVESYWELRRTEYLVVVIFAALVLGFRGAIEKAIVIGTFLGFADFIIEYAKAGHAKFELSSSATVWGRKDTFRLDFCGLRDTILTAKLSGFMFFASAPQIVDDILERVAQVSDGPLPHRKVVLVDWQSVIGVDTAAALEFERLECSLFKEKVVVLFCGMSPSVEATFRKHGILPAASSGEEEEVKGQEDKPAEAKGKAEGEAGEEAGEEAKGQAEAEAEAEDEAEAEAEDEAERESSIFVAADLEAALRLAEVLQLRLASAADARAALREAAALAGGGAELAPRRRFSVLAKALASGSAISRTLRLLVARDQARLLTFDASAVISAPGAMVDHLLILLAGSVEAYTDAQLRVLRHVEPGHVFGEEALTSHCHSKLGYRAAPSCVLLRVAPADLRPEEHVTLCRALAEQQIALKSMLTQSSGLRRADTSR